MHMMLNFNFYTLFVHIESYNNLDNLKSFQRLKIAVYFNVSWLFQVLTSIGAKTLFVFTQNCFDLRSFWYLTKVYAPDYPIMCQLF